MFGMPAVYAGQRLVAFVGRDGLICRLGVGEVTKARGIRARPLVMKGRASRGWTRIHPRSPRDLREVAVLLELATANALGTKSWQSRRP
jgi:hypothetical protein